MQNNDNLMDREDVRELVRSKYGAAALTVLNGQGAACCGGSAGGGKKNEGDTDCCGGSDAITGKLYTDTEAASIPEAALLASLGCGNPTALAQLNAGEVVLDLGSGGGIDVLLSASRVGPTGYVYGLDMTDEMLALAESNRAQAGAENVKFMKGHIEEIPLPDNSVDVIISNCVINLSADKDAVLKEAFRVLKPGGRFAVSDVVVDGHLPEQIRADMEAYVGCVAGALERDEYLAKLKSAGFADASIEPTRRYTFADLEESACSMAAISTLSASEIADLDGRVMGGFIRATKPLATEEACCGTDCCSVEPNAVTESGCCGDDCCGEVPGAEQPAKLVQVFDPALCCSTGVCGASVDPALVAAARNLAWLKQRGVAVERFNLGQQAAEFVNRPEILAEIQKDATALPIVMVDGKIVSQGGYPTLETLLEVLGISTEELPEPTGIQIPLTLK